MSKEVDDLVDEIKLLSWIWNRLINSTCLYYEMNGVGILEIAYWDRVARGVLVVPGGVDQ